MVTGDLFDSGFSARHRLEGARIKMETGCTAA